MPRTGLYFTRTGGIRIKRYLDEMKGVPLNDLWTDVPPINSQAEERLGYPTQKPLKLLERIIGASSNPGDMVLDPFCGCATTCVAAETLGREWAGIDLSPLAVTLVGRRLREHHGVFGQIIDRTDIPHRTDQGKPASYRTAPSRSVRRAGRTLQRMSDSLPVPQPDGRSYRAPVEGR